MTLLDRPPTPASGPSHRGSATGTARTGSSAAPLHDGLAARVRLRRALVLMGMTLLLPGSAQLVAGRRAVGRVAIRVWLGLLALCLAGLLTGAVAHRVLFWLAANTVVLGLLRVGLVVVAVCWALLLIDAWRLGQPLALRRRQRLLLVGLNGALVFGVAGALLFASHLVAVQRGFVAAMFGDGVASAAEHGRYNVLLVGGDSGLGRFGLRADSVTVASIDEATGRTVLFGLPRNLTRFPFPEGSVLDTRFPHGYDCEGCTLNSLATWAADHQGAFAGSSSPGMAATIEGVEGITGLRINYYALVDLDGFRSLVTAMGGLTLNVRDRIPIGYPATDWIEPGVRKLNGFETLWFARARETADDYSRMARQKCVMSAMLQQLSPQTVLTRFEDLTRASESLIETDLPASEVGTFVDLALKARSLPLGTVSFVPPAIDTSEPDLAKIRTMIQSALERSQAPGRDRAHRAASGKGFDTRRGGSTTGGSIGSLSQGYAANRSADLSQAC